MNIFSCLTSKSKEKGSTSANKPGRNPNHLVPPNKVNAHNNDDDQQSNFSSSQASNFNNLHRKDGNNKSQVEDPDPYGTGKGNKTNVQAQPRKLGKGNGKNNKVDVDHSGNDMTQNNLNDDIRTQGGSEYQGNENSMVPG